MVEVLDTVEILTTARGKSRWMFSLYIGTGQVYLT